MTIRGPANDMAERSPSDNPEPTKGFPAPKSLAAAVPDRHEDDDGSGRGSNWPQRHLEADRVGGIFASDSAPLSAADSDAH